MSIWKKLYDDEKLRWDVQSDEKLFTLIEAFAERIIEKSLKIQNELSDLSKHTTGTTVELSCAFNELSNLASSQFVANVLSTQAIPEIATEISKPVESDQQNSAPVNRQTTTLSAARMEKVQSQEKREQNLLPKHQKAIQMALKGLKVEELMKDGAGDDGVSMSSIGSQVFRGTIKKLPHIIGTSYFFHDPWIGLFEEDEQKLEANDEAFTTVFEAKDAPKIQESPMATVGGTAYAPPVPPPMQKTPPPIPPPTNQTPPAPPSQQKAPPPPPPPPPQNRPPPPPPPPSGNNAPPPEVAPGGEFNNFQKGLAATLQHRKAIIDGEVKGDLSVKNVLTDESKALGIPAPKQSKSEKPKNPSSSPPAPPKPQQNTPPAQLNPAPAQFNPPPAPPKQVYEESYEAPPVPKRPEEMTLEDKRKQLAGIIGGGMARKPEPPKEETDSYQQPPNDTPQTYQPAPTNRPPAPPMYQQPVPNTQQAKPAGKPEEIKKTGQFLPNITEDEEIDTLFRPAAKTQSKDKKNYSGLFDIPQDDKKSVVNEPKKTRAEGLFKFIEEDDSDTANLLLNSDLAKKKLGKTTAENPFLFKTDPAPKNTPASKPASNLPLFAPTEKPKAAQAVDDPLSAGIKMPALPVKDQSPGLQAKPSVKEIQASVPMPVFGGPPPARIDKPVEVSNDVALSKPTRQRTLKPVSDDFDDFDDDSDKPKPKTGGMFKSSAPAPFAPTATLPKTDPLGMPTIKEDPLLPNFGNSSPKAPNPPSSRTGKNVSPKPPPAASRKADMDDPLFSDFKAPVKPSPRPSVKKDEEEKKQKPRTSLFDDDEEELSFRPSKPTPKETGGRKQRGSLFDD